jgi:hypothetical protein
MSVSIVSNGQMMVHSGLERIWKKAVLGPAEVLILASAWKELEKVMKTPVRAKPVLQPRSKPSIFQILHKPAELFYLQRYKTDLSPEFCTPGQWAE